LLEPDLIGTLFRYAENWVSERLLDGSGDATAVIPNATVGMEIEEGSSFICPGKLFLRAEPVTSSISGLATEVLTITLI